MPHTRKPFKFIVLPSGRGMMIQRIAGGAWPMIAACAGPIDRYGCVLPTQQVRTRRPWPVAAKCDNGEGGQS